MDWIVILPSGLRHRSTISGRIELSGPALKVLFVFYKRARLVFKQRPEAGAATELPIRLFVSQKVLSKQTGLSKRAIVKAVKELETARFIEAASGGQRVRGKGRRANHYYLLHDGEALLKVCFYNNREELGYSFTTRRTRRSLEAMASVISRAPITS